MQMKLPELLRSTQRWLVARYPADIGNALLFAFIQYGFYRIFYHGNTVCLRPV